MNTPEIDDFVVLMRDRPEQRLRWGDLGVIRHARRVPQLVYEVEFCPDQTQRPVQVLLSPEYFQLVPRSPFDLPSADGGSLYF